MIDLLAYLSKDAIERLESLYKNSAVLIEKYKHIIKCKPGCSACCRSFPWHLIEIAYIVSPIKKLSKKQRIKLNNKIKRYDLFYEERFPKGNFEMTLDNIDYIGNFDDYSCIFLKNNMCLIYPYRPLVCRLTISYKAEGCDGNNIPKDFEQERQPLFEILHSLNKEFCHQISSSSCLGMPFRFFDDKMLK